MKADAYVIAHGTDRTTHTNGFVLGRVYPARGSHNGGWEVLLDDNVRRFVGPDGGGGAHLQHQNGRTGYDFDVSTAGHFEIIPADVFAEQVALSNEIISEILKEEKATMGDVK